MRKQTDYSLEVSRKEMNIRGAFQALFFRGYVNFHLGDLGDFSSNSGKGEGYCSSMLLWRDQKYDYIVWKIDTSAVYIQNDKMTAIN